MITDRQTANVQARQMLTNLGLQGEGAYQGADVSLESQLAQHIVKGVPFRAFTTDGQRINYDGDGHIDVSPINRFGFH